MPCFLVSIQQRKYAHPFAKSQLQSLINYLMDSVDLTAVVSDGSVTPTVHAWFFQQIQKLKQRCNENEQWEWMLEVHTLDPAVPAEHAANPQICISKWHSFKTKCSGRFIWNRYHHWFIWMDVKTSFTQRQKKSSLFFLQVDFVYCRHSGKRPAVRLTCMSADTVQSRRGVHPDDDGTERYLCRLPRVRGPGAVSRRRNRLQHRIQWSLRGLPT